MEQGRAAAKLTSTARWKLIAPAEEKGKPLCLPLKISFLSPAATAQL